MTTTYRLDIEPGANPFWTDMPEVRPRTRMRPGPTAKQPIVIVISDEGMATIPSGADVQVDVYGAAKYKDVRDEGVARWSRYDEMKPKKKEK